MYAIASSGGKDSTFALFTGQQQGFPITHLFHIYNPDTSRTRFHGYKPDLVAAQAEALGLEVILSPTRWDEFDEDFGSALVKLKELGIKGLIFANLHLEDVREFYETRVKKAGLEYHDLLWKKDLDGLMEDFINNRFKAIITSVWLPNLPGKYLGRFIDRDFLNDIRQEKDVDICGEKGEYHSLAFDGPCFKKPLEYEIHGEHLEKDNVFLDIRTRNSTSA